MHDGIINTCSMQRRGASEFDGGGMQLGGSLRCGAKPDETTELHAAFVCPAAAEVVLLGRKHVSAVEAPSVRPSILAAVRAPRSCLQTFFRVGPIGRARSGCLRDTDVPSLALGLLRSTRCVSVGAVFVFCPYVPAPVEPCLCLWVALMQLEKSECGMLSLSLKLISGLASVHS